MKKELVTVVCQDSNGESTLFCVDVQITEDGYNLGEYYDKAKEAAIEAGYEGPFVCFDSAEATSLLNGVEALKKMRRAKQPASVKDTVVKFIQEAKETHEDGVFIVNDDAPVDWDGDPENGAYVQAWVWVPPISTNDQEVSGKAQ